MGNCVSKLRRSETHILVVRPPVLGSTLQESETVHPITSTNTTAFIRSIRNITTYVSYNCCSANRQWRNKHLPHLVTEIDIFDFNVFEQPPIFSTGAPGILFFASETSIRDEVRPHAHLIRSLTTSSIESLFDVGPTCVNLECLSLNVDISFYDLDRSAMVLQEWIPRMKTFDGMATVILVDLLIQNVKCLRSVSLQLHAVFDIQAVVQALTELPHLSYLILSGGAYEVIPLAMAPETLTRILRGCQSLKTLALHATISISAAQESVQQQQAESGPSSQRQRNQEQQDPFQCGIEALALWDLGVLDHVSTVARFVYLQEVNLLHMRLEAGPLMRLFGPTAELDLLQVINCTAEPGQTLTEVLGRPLGVFYRHHKVANSNDENDHDNEDNNGQDNGARPRLEFTVKKVIVEHLPLTSVEVLEQTAAFLKSLPGNIQVVPSETMTWEQPGRDERDKKNRP
ncbi:hypothetical protein BG011_004718 [Mortierella polycephala]|uniref:Uncharacterized protein n=1 Tax=Mortierella polycephala TaxID=41804 RepID=A0A9P6U196_9FUNG|nr:hypothetical protein BG011_004718 [Mortierella polycephala]